MGKQRMTALDVRATVAEMRQHLVSLRLSNIYDISAKLFIFRFGSGDQKRTVLLENGVRLHLTELEREKPQVPSQFTLKLRKHIRSWRLESIEQLAHDRTVDLCFGVAASGNCFHILIELFGKGNVLLTDHTYKTMMLLHTVKEGEVERRVGALYPIGAATSGSSGVPPQETDREKEKNVSLVKVVVDAQGSVEIQRDVIAALTCYDPKEHQPPQQNNNNNNNTVRKEQYEEYVHRLGALWSGLTRTFQQNADHETLKSSLAGVSHFGPALADHVLAVAGIHNCKLPDTAEELARLRGEEEAGARAPVPAALRALVEGKIAGNTADSNIKEVKEIFLRLVPALLEAWDLMHLDVPNGGGYLITQSKKKSTANKSKANNNNNSEGVVAGASAPVTAAVYDDFTPILLAQYQRDGVESVTHRSSFGRVCDEYFLSSETEKIDTHNGKRKTKAMSKTEKFERDHARRIRGLETEEEMCRRKGDALVLNADAADEAIELINSALATGIQWASLRELVKRRRAEGHPVAYMIHDLHFERNSMSLLVEDELEDGEEDQDIPAMVIEVDLAKSAHANAAEWFAKGKEAHRKRDRTLAATEKAAAGAAHAASRSTAKQKEKKVILKVRQREWWEKFYLFRTTAGDVVLRGKDVQTTELLLRRVRRLGDIFVHCDVDGALPCLLRPLADLWGYRPAAGAPPTLPVTMESLMEAGSWCVLHSTAWERKHTVGAWWVYASQIHGGSASGSYLHEGDKNYLPPQPLTLGCALFFRVQRRVADGAGTDFIEVVSRSGEVQHKQNTDEDDDDEKEKKKNKEKGDVEGEGEVVKYPAELPNVLLQDGSRDCIGGDTAAALAELLTVEALRADQQRQRGSYVPHHANPSSTTPASFQAKNSGKGKKKNQSGARNSRVDKAGLAENTSSSKHGKTFSSHHHSEEDDEKEGTATTASTGPSHTLSKHQKKKLKKIQQKYGDQDDEDRALGARINGNNLAQVQRALLEEEKEEERLAHEAASASPQQQTTKKKKKNKKSGGEKEEPHAARVGGALRYKPLRGLEGEEVSIGGDSDDETKEEVIEEVSDFSDGDEPQPEEQEIKEEENNNAAHVQENEQEEEESETREALTPAPSSVFSAAPSRTSDASIEAAAAAYDAELRSSLAFFTLAPRHDDVVEQVLLLSAPMAAIAGASYRVEVSMGAMKKGQIAQSMLTHFRLLAGGHAGEDAGRKGKPNRGRSGGASAALERRWANAAVSAILHVADANDFVEQIRANVKTINMKA